MPVTISGDGVFGGLTSVETVDVKHPDSEDVNIVLADDGSVTLDSIPASIQSAIDGIPQIAGIGSNAVQTVTTGSQTINATFANHTGLAVTITPSSATSKILLLVQLGGGAEQPNGTGITTRVTATSGGNTANLWQTYQASGGRIDFVFSGFNLHSPATTSAVTYQVQSTASGAVFRYYNSLTAIEVAV